jgi:hypothetical protein
LGRSRGEAFLSRQRQLLQRGQDSAVLSAYPKIPLRRRKIPGECFNAGIFQAMELILGYALKAYPMIPQQELPKGRFGFLGTMALTVESSNKFHCLQKPRDSFCRAFLAMQQDCPFLGKRKTQASANGFAIMQLYHL